MNKSVSPKRRCALRGLAAVGLALVLGCVAALAAEKPPMMEVRGRVVLESTGKPVPGVLVDFLLRDGVKKMCRVSTDDRGEFTVSLQPGSGYDVVIDPWKSDAFGRAAITTARDPKQQTVLVLKATPCVGVSGSVAEADTGRPVTGVRVVCLRMTSEGGSEQWESRTDDKGAFAIGQLPGEGRYRLSASGPEHGQRSGDRVFLNLPTNQPVALKVHRLVQLRGRLVGRDGKVVAYSGAYRITDEGVCDTGQIQDGTWQTAPRRLLPGEYRLGIPGLADGGCRLRDDGKFTVPEGAQSPVACDFVLDRLVPVQILVKDADSGAAIPDAGVTVDVGGRRVLEAKTDAAGQVSVTLGLGKATIAAWHKHYAGASTEAVVGENAPPMVVRLKRGIVLDGSVVNRDGRPVSSVNVLVLCREGLASESAWVDDKGRFEISPLPRGPAILLVIGEEVASVARRLRLEGDTTENVVLNRGAEVRLDIDLPPEQGPAAGSPGLDIVDPDTGMSVYWGPASVIRAKGEAVRLLPGKYMLRGSLRPAKGEPYVWNIREVQVSEPTTTIKVDMRTIPDHGLDKSQVLKQFWFNRPEATP